MKRILRDTGSLHSEPDFSQSGEEDESPLYQKYQKYFIEDPMESGYLAERGHVDKVLGISALEYA